MSTKRKRRAWALVVTGLIGVAIAVVSRVLQWSANVEVAVLVAAVVVCAAVGTSYILLHGGEGRHPR